MSNIEQKTTEALEQFTKDLEAGDLSGFLITQWAMCPACDGRGSRIGTKIDCWRCNGYGSISILVQEGNQLTTDQTVVADMDALDLCRHIRNSEQTGDAVLELVRRVEKMMVNEADCIPGSAADWVRHQLDPVPQCVLDAFRVVDETWGSNLSQKGS